MSNDLYTHENPFLAIDGTECETMAEVYDYNASFWNNAICLEPENPIKTIMTHYFKIATEKLSDSAIGVAEWLAFYETFKLALDNGFLSKQFLNYYGNMLLNVQFFIAESHNKFVYMKTVNELLAKLKESNLAKAEEPKK